MTDKTRTPTKSTTNILVYFFGALGGLLFGYDTGVISGALLYINDALGLTPLLSGLVVSSLLVGAMAGAVTVGRLADAFGRRKLVLTAAIIFAAGAVGSALAPGVGVLVAFRVVLGFAVGAASVIVPLYLAEIAPTETRGAVASLNQLMITVGILAAYIVNSALAPFGAWRWMLGLAVIPSLAMLLGMIFMPESPRWLVRKNREGEARNVLGRTRNESAVENEMADIKRVENRQEAGFREILAPWLRPTLVVGLGLAVLQQLVGINTIIYYTPTTLTSVGFGDVASIIGSVGIGTVNVLLTVVAILLVDRIGRKPLLLVGAACMSTSLVVLAITSLLLPQPTGISLLGIVTLLCLALFVASFAATWGAVLWVVLAEIFPLNVRGAAMGIATMLLWAANFLVSLTFPILLEAVGIGYLFLGYAVISAAAFGFVRSFFTETKGRSLEKIEADLRYKALV